MLLRSPICVRVPDQVVPFTAILESEVLGAREVPEDVFDRLPVRFAWVVEELRERRYGERDVGACGNGRICSEVVGLACENARLVRFDRMDRG